MRISQKRNRRLLAVLVFELAVLAVLSGVLDNASRPAISGVGPYTVAGYVTDAASTPVEGADVAVLIVQTGITLHCTTASDGYYQVEFLESEWNDWNDITVIATFGEQATETGVCDPVLTYSQIDVQFTFEIPEFGSVMGSMVAIAAVGVVAALFVWKRPR